MVTIALLAALGHDEEVAMHVRATANTGATPGGHPRGAAARRDLRRRAGGEPRVQDRQADLQGDGGGAMTDGEFFQRDRTLHPPALTPNYKTSVTRSPRYALLSLQNSLSEITGPTFGHSDLGPLDNDLILNYAHGGEPIGERIVVHGRVLDESGRGGAEHPGRVLAGQCRRPLPPQEGHLPRADRPELRRLRPGADRRERLLLLPHRQARRLPVAELGQQLAAGAHPLLGLRHRASPSG